MVKRFLHLSYVAIAVWGCSDNPAAPDVSDPAKYAFSSDVFFRCNAWEPAQPTVALGLYDIFFADQGVAPAQAKIDAIEAARGAVVHRYQLNGVRVIASPAAISQLNADEIVGVRNANTFLAHVSVGVIAPENAAIFTSLGGSIEFIGSAAPYTIIGSIPDASLPALRASSQVRYVEWSGPLCGFSEQ